MAEVLWTEIVFPIINCASWLDPFSTNLWCFSGLRTGQKRMKIDGNVLDESTRQERPHRCIVIFDTHHRIFSTLLLLPFIII